MRIRTNEVTAESVVTLMLLPRAADEGADTIFGWVAGVPSKLEDTEA